jgi:hypothetical protein
MFPIPGHPPTFSIKEKATTGLESFAAIGKLPLPDKMQLRRCLAAEKTSGARISRNIPRNRTVHQRVARRLTEIHGS